MLRRMDGLDEVRILDWIEVSLWARSRQGVDRRLESGWVS